MSTQTLIHTMQQEIERLNATIDIRIIRGLSYKKEAQRHKFLSAQIATLTRPPAKFKVRSQYNSWFRRTARMVASFTL